MGVQALEKGNSWVLKTSSEISKPESPASTGKAAKGINDVTLHSAFDFLFKSQLKSYKYKKPSDGTLHILRNK